MSAAGAGGALGGHLAFAQGAGVFRWQPPDEPVGTTATADTAPARQVRG